MSRPPTLPLLATAAEEHNLEDDDSDEEMFTVPEMEEKGEDTREMVSQGSLQSSNNNNNGGGGGGGEQVASVKRRRGRNPVDKEYRRLKRLLRNRVSAQQAREKKKVYVNDLESRAKELQDNSFRLEEKISILTNENTMLRKVLMNSRAKVDENEDTKHG